jgi:hypothetical protein
VLHTVDEVVQYLLGDFGLRRVSCLGVLADVTWTRSRYNLLSLELIWRQDLIGTLLYFVIDRHLVMPLLPEWFLIPQSLTLGRQPQWG